MTTLDPGFYPLARTAANRLVKTFAYPDVVKATLAIWIAENGWDYPPARNNPGNNSRDWAEELQVDHCVAYPNPQPGNPIVSYLDLDTGAKAFADGVRLFARYVDAKAKAIAGDGLDYGLALIAAGFGTRADTFQAVYGQLPAPPPIERTADQDVNLHDEPNLAAKVTGKVKDGQTVEVLTKATGGSYVANGVTRTDWYLVAGGWGVAGHLR